MKRTTFDRMELRFLYPPARFLIPIVDVGVWKWWPIATLLRNMMILPWVLGTLFSDRPILNPINSNIS